MQYDQLYRRLLEIPADQFVMHGSPHRLDTVEPHQAVFEGRPELSRYGVYATQVIEVAVLYAVIHEKRDLWGYAHLPLSDFMEVHVPSGFQPRSGFIHVLPKQAFERVCSYTYLACSAVQPTMVFPVQAEALRHLERDGVIEVLVQKTAPA